MTISLSEAERSAAASTPIPFRRLLDWGALDRLSTLAGHGESDYAKQMRTDRIADEERFRAWTGFGERDSMLVSEALKVKIHPHFLLWVLIRRELFADALLHLWNLQLCRDVHADIEAAGTAIHFRLGPLLEVRERHIARQASLGNVRHASREARYIHEQCLRSGDERSVAAALATLSALWDDPETSFRQLLGIAKTQQEEKKVYARHVAFIRKSLAS